MYNKSHDNVSCERNAHSLPYNTAFSWQGLVVNLSVGLPTRPRIVSYLRSSSRSLKEVSCKVPVSPFILFTLAQTYRKCCSAKTHCEETRDKIKGACVSIFTNWTNQLKRRHTLDNGLELCWDPFEATKFNLQNRRSQNTFRQHIHWSATLFTGQVSDAWKTGTSKGLRRRRPNNVNNWEWPHS